MTKRKCRILIWLFSVFGIIGIATATAIFFLTLDQNEAKKYISAGVSKATGRQLSINGDLKLDLGWISRLSASQIQFENAQWEQAPTDGRSRIVRRSDRSLATSESVPRGSSHHYYFSQPKVILEKN